MGTDILGKFVNISVAAIIASTVSITPAKPMPSMIVPITPARDQYHAYGNDDAAYFLPAVAAFQRARFRADRAFADDTPVRCPGIGKYAVGILCCSHFYLSSIPLARDW